MKLGDYTKNLPPTPILVGTVLYLIFTAVVFEAIWGDGGRVARAGAAIIAGLMIGLPTFSLWSKYLDRSYLRGLQDQAERDEKLVVPDSPAGLE